MYARIQKLTDEHSFFLFGARGTGKSTLLGAKFTQDKVFLIDLLDKDVEEKYARNPMELAAQVRALSPEITHVIIDEIQKLPKLLDVVHLLLEDKTVPQQFALTGSSARKLKYGGANLLAGRAFVYHLHPLTFIEQGDDFNLDQALHWGNLPKISGYNEDAAKRGFLKAYAQTYLKEEVWDEHIIRKLDPFRKFLEVAAQSNGKIINMAKIARDVGADPKTVKEYFSILEDTLLGFFLEPFHNSLRKRLTQTPKFYFFDVGVTRALARLLSIPVSPQTSYYGEVFEHFIILECIRLADYYEKDYKFSFLRTSNNIEIDLVVDRPGLPLLLIEIKSRTQVGTEDIRNLMKMAEEIECEAVCFSRDTQAKKLGNVMVYPWASGIKKLFT